MKICDQNFMIVVMLMLLPMVLCAPRDNQWYSAWQIRRNTIQDPPIPVEKRAMLAMLSRWRPLTSAVYKLLRAHPQRPNGADVDFVSAETRGNVRPPGQPLRWGR